MALFGKNPNEAAYTGGKKHWADVIKNTGPGELLIWRQPEEDFNTNSTLIVMPGEEATPKATCSTVSSSLSQSAQDVLRTYSSGMSSP